MSVVIYSTSQDDVRVPQGVNNTIFGGQSKASLTFKMRLDPATDCTKLSGGTIGRNGLFIGFSPVSGDPTTLQLVVNGKDSANIGYYIRTGGAIPNLQRGITYSISVSYAVGSNLALYVNGIKQTNPNTLANPLPSANTLYPFMVQVPATTSSVSVTFSDVGAWDGYQFTDSDAMNLMDGTYEPNTLPTPATHYWSLAIPAGKNVGDTASIADSAFNDLSGSLPLSYTPGTGTLTYDSTLVYVPPMMIEDAHVGTGSDTIFISFKDVVNGNNQYPTAINTPPTIRVNGTAATIVYSPAPAPLMRYTMFRISNPVSQLDNVTVDVSENWATAPIGGAQAQTGVSVRNLAGKSIGGWENGSRALKCGVNLANFGGVNSANGYPVFRNWRLRLWPWSNIVSSTLDGYPTQFTGTSTSTALIGSSAANGIDSRNFPAPTGLVAIQWDTNDGTTFDVTINTTTTMTVSERQDLMNPGVLGSDGWTRGVARVFQVSRASGAASENGSYNLRLTKSDGKPSFSNLFIHFNPDNGIVGDFDYTPGVPVQLDRSDDTAMSRTFLDRFPGGPGSIRTMDAVLSYAGNSMMTEPEDLRVFPSFSYNNQYFNYTFGPTSAGPFSPSSTNPRYIYLGWNDPNFLPFNMTLASPVNATATSFTITAPDADSIPIRGLYFTFPNGEKARIQGYTGTYPNYTCTVERGSFGTTASSQAAGSVPCTGRRKITSLSDLGNGWVLWEVVGANVHNFANISQISLKGSWPVLYFTKPSDGQQTFMGSATTGLSGYLQPYMVTGQDKILIFTTSNQNNYPCVTVNNTITLDQTANQLKQSMPDPYVGLPYEAGAIIVAKTGAKCGLFNLPVGCSDAYAYKVANSLVSYMPVGSQTYIELSNETWNISSATLNWTTNIFSSLLAAGGNGQQRQLGLVYRSGQLVNIIKSVYAKYGRASEVRLMTNCQAVSPGDAKACLDASVSTGVPIDAIATAPYIDPSYSVQMMRAYHGLSDASPLLDLWVHDLLFNDSIGGWRNIFNQTIAFINSYNTTNGRSCIHISYEGNCEKMWPQFPPPGTSSATLATAIDGATNPITLSVTNPNSLCAELGMTIGLDSESFIVTGRSADGATLTATRAAWGTAMATHAAGAKFTRPLAVNITRDMQYHPNMYFVDNDRRYMMETVGMFQVWNEYTYSLNTNGYQDGWGDYTWYSEPYGRGDGSIAGDGIRHDNRLLQATPGKQYSKTASQNFNLIQVSVRGQAFRDWNAGVIPSSGGGGGGGGGGGSSGAKVVRPRGPRYWRRYPR